MNKTKSFSLMISILSIMAIAVMLPFQFVSGNKTNALTNTSQSVSVNVDTDYFAETSSQNDTQKVLEYKLYGTDADSYNFLSFFSAKYNDDRYSSIEDAYQDYYHYGRSLAAAGKGSGETVLTSNFSISDSLKFAGQNGYLTIQPNVRYSGNNRTMVEVNFYADGSVLFATGEDMDITTEKTLTSLSNPVGNYATISNNYSFELIASASGKNLIIWAGRSEAYFYTPSFTLTSTDVTKPTKSSTKELFTFNTTDWTNSRTVTINVADSQAGLYKVVFKGQDPNSAGTEIANFTENTKDNSAEFTVTENGTYYIDVYDNVGNKTTFEYVEEKIDVFAPEVTITSLDDVNIANATLNLTAREYKFNISVVDNSSTTIYYTTDGTTPTLESKTLTNGENTITFAKGGEFTVNIRVIDEFGNETSTKFNVTVPGEYTITQNLLDSQKTSTVLTSLGGLYGQNVSYTITPSIKDGDIEYIFYKAYLINGEQVSEIFVEDNRIEFPVNETANVRLDYRRIVNITYLGVESDVVQFDTDVAEVIESLTWQFTNFYDEPISTLDGQDYVNAVYLLDNEIYFASGAFTLVNLDVTDNELSFVDSSDAVQNFADYLQITNSANFLNYTIEYTDANEKTYTAENYNISLPAGAYTYKITLNGAYVLNSATASNVLTGEFEVSKKQITLSLDTVSKVYDGEQYEYNADLGYKYTIQYLQNSETVTPVSAGTYTILVTLNEDNYSGSAETTLTINKRPITISITGGQNKYYNTDDPSEFTYEILSGETVKDDVLGIEINREAGEDAGSYALFVNEDLLNPNYQVNYLEEVFTILPINVVLRVNSVSKVYGTNDPEFTVTKMSGAIDDLGKITFTRVAGENVGRYVISITDWANKNYSPTVLNGTLTIEPRTIEISLDSATKEFGASDPEFTYTINSGELLPNDTLNLNITREYGENVGEYKLTFKSSANRNYNVTVKENDAKLTITKAQLTITAQNTSKVFGANDTELTWTADKDFVASAISGKLSRVAGEDAGQYDITQGTLTSDNYDIIFVGGTFTITPATLFVDIANLVKTYGESDPAYIYQVRNSNVEITLNREAGEDAGTYKITASIDNPNYELIYNEAYLTIQKADAVITVEDAQFIYDGTNKTIPATLNCTGDLTITYYRNGEVVDSAINAGDYTATIRFAGNENYNSASTQISFSIAKADAQIVVYRNIFVYSGSAFEPQIACNLPYRITFLDGSTSNQIGEHDYILEICDEAGNVNANYNTFSGYVKIVEVPTNQTTGGSVVFESGDVDNENINLTLDEIKDLQGAENAVNGSVDKVYEIGYNQSSEAVVKVELDYETDDYSNVYVYAYNDNNEAKLLSYQIIDGKIVFSIDAENMKIAIVKQTAGISIVTLGALIVLGAVIAWIVISKTRKHKKTNIIKIS